MSAEIYREVFLYKDHYKKFYRSLDIKTRKKFDWTLDLIETIELVPERYLKHLADTDGLYEIRVEANSNIYRVFCFFDKGKLIILVNGFQKKSQKTPKKEIQKAQQIKKEYFDEK